MINKLVENIKKTGAPIVVVLDPMLNYIPEHVQKKAFAEFGETLEGAAEAVWQFNKEIVDKTYDLIPAVKPQIAMYEQFGIPGLQAFKKTVDYCKSKGLVVIGDIKRGDIGSTSAAYAVGHLGKVKVGSKEYVPFDEDFVTVNPYLGSDVRESVYRRLQRRKERTFHPCEDVKSIQRRVPGSPDRRSSAVRTGRRESCRVGRGVYGRFLQLYRRSCGRDLSGDGKSPQKSDAEIIHPCAGIRRAGRTGKRSGTFLQ